VIRTIGAELLKVRTTRTFWGLTAGAVGLVLLIVVLSLALDDGLGTETDVTELLSVAGFSGLLTLVLGAVVGAGEYRHGTIAWTLLVTPSRLRAVGAQVLACALAGVAIAAIVFLLALAVAIPWLSAKDVSLPPIGDLLEVAAGVMAYAGLAAAFGAALGALLRNQVAAIVIVLVQIFVVDPTIAALDEDAGAFTLTGLGAAISGADDSELLAQGTAALIWTGYTLLLVTLAALRTAKRDI
jgi:ABC-type transport system involved in multi-copper enzyme maturation permease subunit